MIDKKGYNIISAQEAKEIMDTNKTACVLDVRTLDEYNMGHIPNSICIPLDDIEDKVELIIPDKNKCILVYCRSGVRSRVASNKLLDMGYTNIDDFGGINSWPYEITKNK